MEWTAWKDGMGGRLLAEKGTSAPQGGGPPSSGGGPTGRGRPVVWRRRWQAMRPATSALDGDGRSRAFTGRSTRENGDKADE